MLKTSTCFSELIFVFNHSFLFLPTYYWFQFCWECLFRCIDSKPSLFCLVLYIQSAAQVLKMLNQWMVLFYPLIGVQLHVFFCLNCYLYWKHFNLCRLKIFVPITILAFLVLVPVNWTNDTLEGLKVEHSDIDKLSISNIPFGSKRLALDEFIFS